MYEETGCPENTSHYDPLDEVDRRTLLMAAVGEMLRYDDPHYQCYVRGIIGQRGCYDPAFLLSCEHDGWFP